MARAASAHPIAATASSGGAVRVEWSRALAASTMLSAGASLHTTASLGRVVTKTQRRNVLTRRGQRKETVKRAH